MTKIAVLTDVHGNLPALEAALAVIRDEDCDVIYHTGDAVGIGPYPAECVERLIAAGVRCLLGNHEAYVLDLWPQDEESGKSEGEIAHRRWVRSVLESSLLEAVARWPWSLEEEIEGARIAFLHYPLEASRSDFVPIVKCPSAELFDPLFAHYRADLAFYGHHHPASDLRGRCRYVNPGSLGCNTEPIARFAVIDLRTAGITSASTPYDMMMPRSCGCSTSAKFLIEHLSSARSSGADHAALRTRVASARRSANRRRL